MSRFVFFLVLLAGIAILNSLKSYKTVPLNNARFDIKETEKLHKEEIKKVADLAMAREEILHPKAKKEVVVQEGPLVVLSTPELQRGHDLYGKCVVCHGKRGEGKKSQNAPRLGGQHDWYLLTQLENMKSKVRVNKVMDPYIKKLDSQDFKDLAAYISKLPKQWVK